MEKRRRYARPERLDLGGALMQSDEAKCTKAEETEARQSDEVDMRWRLRLNMEEEHA